MQASNSCGALKEDCCYTGGDVPLCGDRSCDPGFKITQDTDLSSLPCLCSEGTCEANADYVCDPTKRLCDQSRPPEVLQPCGGQDEPCCNGVSCDEDVEIGSTFVDLECGKEDKICKVPEAVVRVQSTCGLSYGKCCSDGSCEDASFECRFEACLPAANCARKGDVCCDGNKCSAEYLACDTMEGSIFEGLCVQCGDRGGTCCKNDEEEEYCSGSNMECVQGVCITVPGPCDQNQKGCCKNKATGSHYCTSTDSERLSCDAAPEGDIAKCQLCGGDGEACCFPTEFDAGVVTPSNLATGEKLCEGDGQACMLDPGSADFYGRCVTCGEQPGDPCCWMRKSVEEPSILNTPFDYLVPSCKGEGLICQEFVADDLILSVTSNLYRCVEETDVGGDKCGGYRQRCCLSQEPSMQCGIGLACNMDSLSCEECGLSDQLCCPSLVPEMQQPVCGLGFGCDNTEPSILKRTCKECGLKDGPCCWDAWSGFTCNDGMSCTGVIGGATCVQD